MGWLLLAVVVSALVGAGFVWILVTAVREEERLSEIERLKED